MTFTKRVRKRAEYEAFEFALEAGGVRVRNASHADPSEHEYLVRFEDGLPASCTCPADERFEGACKHRVAVAIRRAVLEPALRASVATDGGTVPEESTAVDEVDESDCDCASLPAGVPCWPCFRAEEAAFEEPQSESVGGSVESSLSDS